MSSLSEDDRRRRSRLEEIIREGRRVRTNVNNLRHQSSSYPLSTSSATSYYQQRQPQPLQQPLQHPHHPQPQYHQPNMYAYPPPSYAPPPPPQQQQWLPHPSVSPQQQHQPRPHQPPPSPMRSQPTPLPLPLPLPLPPPDNTFQRLEQQHIDAIHALTQQHTLEHTTAQHTIQSSQDEITRLKQAMTTLANEADERIQLLTKTCQEQQQQIKTLVLHRTASEAEMNQRALLQNRKANAREAEQYRQLVKQLEKQHQAESLLAKEETNATIATFKAALTRDYEEKHRTHCEQLQHQCKATVYNLKVQHRNAQKKLVQATSVLISELSHEFQQYRNDIVTMKQKAQGLKQNVKKVSAYITTELKYQLQNVAHWSTGAVRVLENQLSRQRDLQATMEERNAVVYDTKADNDYFNQLKMKNRLKQ